MPITYTVTEARQERLPIDSTGDSVSIGWHKNYYVDVSGYSNLDEIDIYSVASATGLPIVNKTAYEVNNKIIPYVICRSKHTERDSERADRFHVTTSYKATNKTSESGNTPIEKPAALTDITPQVVQSLGEIQRVLYEDKSDSPKKILTPTLNDWADPAIERIPTLILKITQYESSVTYEQMLERRFKVNSATYRSQPRYKWLIQNVEGIEATVSLSGGDTTAALMTYTLVYMPLDHGWKDRRALLDTHYYSEEPETLLQKLRFTDAMGNGTLGLVDINGNKKPSQEGEPDYIEYETYDDINFGSFLLV